MSDYLEIATSLHTNSLTLFVGTGFSKYMTNGKAPSWLELLVECTTVIDVNNKLLNQLFKTNSKGVVSDAKYDLTICAQIIESEYLKNSKNIKEQITGIIQSKINEKTIDLNKLEQLQKFFTEHPNINIITTNYDTIFSDFVIPLTSRVVIEGSIIPRLNSGQNIYHIHGCINKPESIILTIKDYYNFQNSNNYFSRKFFTLLQETTVVILGYSLGDFNLNTILNEVKNSKKESYRRSEIYYVTKDSIEEVIEKYYTMTYGIKSIQNTNVEHFFSKVDLDFGRAKTIIDSIEDLKNVISGSHYYTNDFLKMRISLTSILLQAASLGIESKDEKFIKVLINLLDTKKGFTRENNAWEQYEHLADWLIDIASIISIKNTEFELKFCNIVKYSLSYSSKGMYKGYSWHAWESWFNRWHEMKLENQHMIENIINNNKWDSFTEIPLLLQK